MDTPEHERTHEAIRKWLQALLLAQRWTSFRLAKEAGVSPSTISRALNDNRFILSTKTLNKIKKAVGINSETESVSQFISLVFPTEIEKIDNSIISEHLKNLLNGKNFNYYLSHTKNMNAIGIFPGDIVVADSNLIGRPSDIVLASIVSSDRTEKYAIRYLDPPYLLTKSLDVRDDDKPMLVDGDLIKVVGPVVYIFRDLTNPRQIE